MSIGLVRESRQRPLVSRYDPYERAGSRTGVIVLERRSGAWGFRHRRSPFRAIFNRTSYLNTNTYLQTFLSLLIAAVSTIQ